MTGTVYRDGQPITFGEIPSPTLSADGCEYQEEGLTVAKEITGSISFKTNITARQEIMLMTGKLPSNNWMKMHGGVMERKAGRRHVYRRNKI
jgi:hypothetical protein